MNKSSQAIVYPKSAVILMARLITETGAFATKGSISSITLKSYDLSAPSTEVYSGTVNVATAVYDAPQNIASLWDVDADGFNFKHVPPVNAIPLGGKTYQLEYMVTPVSGTAYPIVFELQTKRLYSVA